jgi:hypothetical protein
MCDLLLTVSAAVHANKTSWSATVFGSHKDGETLAALLSKDEFKGVLVSDDAAVYQGFVWHLQLVLSYLCFRID